MKIFAEIVNRNHHEDFISLPLLSSQLNMNMNEMSMMQRVQNKIKKKRFENVRKCET